MRVYVGDRRNGQPRVVVFERSVGQELSRIEATEQAMSAKPLADWSPIFSVPWGDTGPGSLDLADCILCDAFRESPPRHLAVRFRDEVIARLPRQGFELPVPDVTAWYAATLGQETERPALAVASAAEAPQPGRDAATASALVSACEGAWAAIQAHHPGVPDAVIVLGTGVERGRLVKLGHWWGGRWLADGSARGEVLLAGEALHLPPTEVFEVLLHEAAHGLNAARGVQDASRGGRYHNQRFRQTAAALGLRVEQMRPYGWARTTLTLTATELYAEQIAALSESMRIARQLQSGVRVGAGQEGPGLGRGAGAGQEAGGPGRTRNGVGAACGCGRRLRMAPSVLAQGPVLCGLCGAEFTTGRRLERAVGSGGLAVVDQSFMERRRRALSAETDVTTAQPTVGGHEDAADRLPPGTDRPGMSSATTLAVAGSLLQDVVQAGMLEAWRKSWGTDQEVLLSGRTNDEVARLNQLARQCLKRDGVLHGPAVMVGDSEIVAGERVVVGADGVDWPGGGEPAIPEGVVGVLKEVGRDWVDIDFAIVGRNRFPTATFGPRSLGYGYAIHEAEVACELDLSALNLQPAPTGPVEATVDLRRGLELEP